MPDERRNTRDSHDLRRHSRNVRGLAVLAVVLLSGCAAQESGPTQDYGDSLAAAAESAWRALGGAEPDAVRPLGELHDASRCDEDERMRCDVLSDWLASESPVQHVFFDGDQLSAAGIALSEHLLQAHELGYARERFHAQALRAAINELSATPAPPPVDPASLISDEERASVGAALSAFAATPDEALGVATVALSTDTPDGRSSLVRAAEERRVLWRARLDQVQHVDLLLLRGMLAFLEAERLHNPWTHDRRDLIERQLLLPDPDDEEERAYHGGPDVGQEYLAAWRLEDDEAVIQAREERLIRDRLRVTLESLDQTDVAALLRQASPAHPQYRRLVEALPAYRAAAANGWPGGDVRGTLGPGSRGEAVGRLRARLNAEGYRAGGEDNTAWDDTLGAAVRAFQENHGVRVDGQTGPSTNALLNESPRVRLATLLLTLERWRSTRILEDVGSYYVHANIPDFHAEVRDEGSILRRFRVIVGEETPDWVENSRETIVFSDRMERIVLNPFWYVPQSIINNEILPAIERREEESAAEAPSLPVDAWLSGGAPPEDFVMDEDDEEERSPAAQAYLDSHNYEMWEAGGRTYVKQAPGPGNALGRVKFLFPNEYAIYMHDTPTRHLFSREERALSHGCVRVQEPLALAELLLRRDRGWGHDRVDRYISAALRDVEDETVAHLNTPIPVHIEYFLARATETGQIAFAEDVYGREAEALEAHLVQVERSVSAELAID